MSFRHHVIEKNVVLLAILAVGPLGAQRAELAAQARASSPSLTA